MFNSQNEEYWSDYNGLQHAKHQLLKSYLDAWFPILTSWNGRVIYLDTHAGRGRHTSGEVGSPLLAIRLLLEHKSRERILSNSKVVFIFFESNLENFESLKLEISSLGILPQEIIVEPYYKDYETELRILIDYLHGNKLKLAPMLAFIDPFSFKLSMELLNELLAFSGCELVINFMYRYVDMAMAHPSHAQNLDRLFGTDKWQELRRVSDSKERATKTLNLFANQLNAKYVTHMQMRGANGALKYALIHCSNHKKGKSRIKEAMWKVTPDGSFTAFEKHHPKQMTLINADPDLEPLESALWSEFDGKIVEMKVLYEWLLDTLYLEKHLHKILRELKKQGKIQFKNYSGRFAFNKNPSVNFILPPE